LAAIIMDLWISHERDIIVWNYPSGEILFQKKLDERLNQIEWNPFRPNVFATMNIVSCFFISNSCFHVSDKRRVISLHVSFLQNILLITANKDNLSASPDFTSLHSSGRILTLTYFSGPGLLTRRNYLRA
jgi:hypothetical protein